jgi:hypothetical protein
MKHITVILTAVLATQLALALALMFTGTIMPRSRLRSRFWHSTRRRSTRSPSMKPAPVW